MAGGPSLPELGSHRAQPRSLHGDRIPRYMAVLRNRVGLLEDRFFATVFLGSGLLFVAMLFAAVSIAKGLLDTFASGLPNQNEVID